MYSSLNILTVCLRKDSRGKNVEVSAVDVSSGFSDAEMKMFLYKSILKFYSMHCVLVP